MTLPEDVKRNPACEKTIAAYHRDVHSRWARGEIKKREKTPVEDRTIKDQVKLCILYKTVTSVPFSSEENVLEQYCSDCEIYSFISENEELDNLITRKAEIEAEYKVICECLNSRGIEV